MSLWNKARGGVRSWLPTVSILVLVDVALELTTVIDEVREYLEFQSLFSWMSLWNKENVP